MRIVATSDTHAPVGDGKLHGEILTTYGSQLIVPEGDVFVHAGDLLRVGTPAEWYAALDWLRRLPHPVKLFVPGNHDFHLQLYPGSALQELREIGVWVVGLPGNVHYATYVLPNGMRLLGLPQVVELGRWAFSTTEAELAEYLNRFIFAPDPVDVVVSHAPVLGFLDEAQAGQHVGVAAHRFFLQHRPPRVWIHGHIHESYGRTEVRSGGAEEHVTRIYNVAMCNRDYRQVNPPVVIDL